jgi:hypothetical protein
VPTTIAEFSLGHKIDKLEYNKFYRTDEGKARVEQHLGKVRPFVNVVSGQGGEEQGKESYFEEACRWMAIGKGKAVEEIQEAIVHEVFEKFPQLYTEKTRQLSKEHKIGGELKMADVMAQPKLAYPVFHKFTRDELFPAMLSVAQRLTTTHKKPQQKVIEVEAVQKYIDEGWTFRSSINGHFALMEKDE